MDKDIELSAWRYIRYHYCEKRERLEWFALHAELTHDGYTHSAISRLKASLDSRYVQSHPNTELFDLKLDGWARMIDMLGEQFPGEFELIRIATRILDKHSIDPSTLFDPLKIIEHLADQNGVPRDRVERLVVDLARNRGLNFWLTNEQVKQHQDAMR